MDLSSPIHSVIPNLQGDVLGVLARTERPLSGRAVAELLGGRGSVSGVAIALKRLVEAGVVTAEDNPPAVLYQLNRDHLAADAIIALGTMRERLIDMVRDTVSAWEPPAYGAWLFGSFARGEGGPGSDIDLLVVAPDSEATSAQWQIQLRALSRSLRRATGNDCQILTLTSAEWEQRLTEESRLVHDLRRDGIALTARRIPNYAGALVTS